ncbi:MAG: leucine-rich repeat domain-containing protein, partial [Lachnospiraceae bacterium]|nr:leucine-rich repeat domain-containing protein [Lachnospiraceae bacterium]
MKKTKLYNRVLAAALVFILAVGTLYPSAPAAAFQDTYYGDVKIEEYNALSSFTEDGIKYLVTSRPSGGNNGEVYVNGCDFRLETITIPGLVKHSGSKYDVIGINDKAFMNYENLTKVTIEDGLTYIGGGAFWGCWYLESIKFPKTLKELGQSAFEKCGSLNSITFPDSLTVIPQSVCANSAVSKVTFGSKVTKIGSYAFRNCDNLKEITLPASLKTVEDYAFSECRNLAKINNQSKLKKADYEKAFNSTKWEKGEKPVTGSYTYADKDMHIALYLDNKQLKDGYLYYRMNSYYADDRGFDYDDWEHGACAQLKKDSDGNYILEKKYISEGMYPIDGEFYYCEKKPTDFLKDYQFIFKTGDIPYTSALGQELYDEDTARAEKIKVEQGEEAYNEFIRNRKSSYDYSKSLDDAARPVRLYTVHYEQGEYEARYMPEDRILSRYGYSKPGEGINLFLTGFGSLTHPVSAARAFAYYADSNGKRVDSLKDITGPVTLHPVFVNEDELFKGENYVSEQDYYYTAYMRKDENWSEIADNVRIKSGSELVERLLTDPGKKDGLCIIDSKVTLSCSDLEKYVKSKASDDFSYIKPEMGGYFYNQDDFIVVKSGGTLILDGVRLINGIRVSLQKGAKLQVLNGSTLAGGGISLQEGSEAEIYDGTIDGVIMNSGKITVKTPKYKRATDSFYKKSIDSNLFHNSKTGVIDLDYGCLDWGNDFDKDFGPGAVKSDMRDADDAVVVNNGTINVTGYGHISMESGSQNREHKESYAKTPIVNNGTINITSSSKRFYEFAMIEIDHNSFYNYGTIKVKSDVRRKTYSDSYAGRSAQWENSFYAEIQSQESEFINYGTIELDIKNGTGIAVVENFFPRDRVVKRFEEDGDTASH